MIALLLTSASATEVEANVALGVHQMADPSFDVFTPLDAAPGLGLSAAIRPSGERHVPIALVATWQHQQQGQRVDSGELASFNAAFTIDTFTLGPKVDLEVAEIWAPYLTAQGAVSRGLARFDDDPGDNDSPGQTRAAGVAPGLLLLAGTEFSSHNTRSPLEFVCHMEAGYALMGSVGLGGIGAVQPGGFVLRTGVGMRWGRSGR